MTRDFTIYAAGICATSVCSSLTLEEVTRRLNTASPTGIESRWEPSEAETFSSGVPQPGICEQNPKTHKHYLFEC